MNRVARVRCRTALITALGLLAASCADPPAPLQPPATAAPTTTTAAAPTTTTAAPTTTTAAPTTTTAAPTTTTAAPTTTTAAPTTTAAAPTTTAAAPTTTTAAPTTTTAAPTTPDTASLTFKYDFFDTHLVLRVLQVTRGYRNDNRSDFWLEEGNEWVKVDIEIDNFGGRSQRLSPLNFALVDVNGHELGDTFGAPDTSDSITRRDIKPGARERGSVVMQAPAGQGYLVLAVSPIHFEPQYVRLQSGSTPQPVAPTPDSPTTSVPSDTPTSTPTATPETTVPAISPRIPPYVEVVDRSSSSLTLRASVSDSIATYHEIRRRAATAPVEWTDLGRQDSETFNDHGLDPDTTYYYSARHCNSVGCSRYSEEIGGVTEAAGQVEVPSIPTGVRGMKIDVSLGTDDARVTWSAVSGATYYEVYQGSNFDAEISAPLASYRDYSPNTRFLVGFVTTMYEVRACNKAGCSAFSETVVVS